jgi:hemin uptake protein HemP
MQSVRAIDPINANSYHSAMKNGDALGDSRVMGNPAKQVRRAPQRVGSRQLLGLRGELIIEHQGRDYCLRITQNGKLILTA